MVRLGSPIFANPYPRVVDYGAASARRQPHSNFNFAGKHVSLLTESKAYKPFRYPWAYEAWLQQQRIHWLPEEVPLDLDIRDWKTKLTDPERNLLTQIFRFFTQADIEVNECYMEKYSKVFKPVEVKMMLAAFSNMETIHIAAYSHLLDTLGMPELEYAAFRQYKEMLDKRAYMRAFDTRDNYWTAQTMAVFGAFVEGMQLFASFAILMNFQRFGKMTGMGQIIAWSVRDESLHCASIIRLWHEFMKETRGNFGGAGGDSAMRGSIQGICMKMVDHEDAFIDLAFAMGPVEGLTADEVKQYVRFIANRRMGQLGYPGMYEVKLNPLPWMDDLLNGLEHTNFFENRSTEYAKASTTGTWDDVWQSMDKKIAA